MRVNYIKARAPRNLGSFGCIEKHLLKQGATIDTASYGIIGGEIAPFSNVRVEE